MLCLLFYMLFTTAELEYPQSMNGRLSERIIEETPQTGADNVVAAVLMDFRAFDTFGEILVLYAATTGVVLISKKLKGEGEVETQEEET